MSERVRQLKWYESDKFSLERLPTAANFPPPAHVAEYLMARIYGLIQDVPMPSTGVPWTKEATEVANGGEFIARVAFAPRLVVLSFPALFPEPCPELVPSRVGGKFHGG